MRSILVIVFLLGLSGLAHSFSRQVTFRLKYESGGPVTNTDVKIRIGDQVWEEHTNDRGEVFIDIKGRKARNAHVDVSSVKSGYKPHSGNHNIAKGMRDSYVYITLYMTEAERRRRQEEHFADRAVEVQAFNASLDTHYTAFYKQHPGLDTTGSCDSSKVVEKASFPGGMRAMQEFIVGFIVYPESAIEMNEQGIIYLSFIVEKDGSITEIKVDRGVSSSLDREAKFIIRNMPKWLPSVTENNCTSRSRIRIPITFALN